MPVAYDRVQENSVTTGVGTYTLGGAVAGYRTFAAACSTGDVVPYVAVDTATNDWEIGLGTYSAGTLARTTIRRSTNANAAVSWASGTRQVFIDATAADALASLITSAIGSGTAGQVLASGGAGANPAWSAIPSPVYVSGRYYSSRITPLNNQTTANVLYYMPVLISSQVTVSALAYTVSSGTVTSGTKTRMGIYSCTSAGLPGTLLAASAENTMAASAFPATNNASFGSSITLTPGVYFLGFLANQASSALVACGSSGTASAAGDMQWLLGTTIGASGVITSQFGGYYENYSYAALPSTASSTPTATPGNIVPLISFQVA